MHGLFCSSFPFNYQFFISGDLVEAVRPGGDPIRLARTPCILSYPQIREIHCQFVDQQQQYESKGKNLKKKYYTSSILIRWLCSKIDKVMNTKNFTLH